MEKSRAKFECEYIEDFGMYQKIHLRTQYSDNPEDNSFCEATPCGEMTMQIDNKDIFGFFVPGKSYYLDFTPCE